MTNRGCGNFNTVLELNWIVNRLLDSRLRKGILDAYLIYVSLSTGNTTSVGRWNTSWWIIIQSPCVVPTNYPPRSRKDHRRSSPILTRATNRARIWSPFTFLKKHRWNSLIPRETHP
jgi:hypothetical protein